MMMKMKSIKREMLAAAVFFFACLILAASPAGRASAKTIEGVYRYDLAWELFSYLNQERTKMGIAPLKQDQYLTEIAMTRASEVSVCASHYRPDGSYFTSAGSTAYLKSENYAYNYSSAKKANTALVNSPPHYQAMLSTNYNGVGVGCFEDTNGNLYWTEEFGVYRSAAVQKKNKSTVSAKGKRVTINSIENKSDSIKLTWNEIPGVSGYFIYRKAGSGFYKKVKTITKQGKVTWKDTSVGNKSGTKYTYKVIPFTRSDGKTGTGRKETIVRLTHPTSFRVTADSGTVTAKWKKAPKADGYRIYYSTSPYFTGTVNYYSITDPNKTTFVFPSFETGRAYYIRICAYVRKGASTYYSGYSKTVKAVLYK